MKSLMDQLNDPKEWIYDQCCKIGTLELSKKEFETFFPGNSREELKELEEFCSRKELNFRVNKTKKTFVFELIEADLKGF